MLQLKLLSRYNDDQKIVRDESAHAYAICDQDLEQMYYRIGSKKATGVIIFFAILLVLPLIFLSLVGAVLRSLNMGVHVRIIRPNNHKTVAGFVLTGIFITTFIVACDVTAVVFYVLAEKGETELGQMKLNNKVSFFCTVILLACDGLAAVKMLIVLLYICCKNINDNASEEATCDNCSLDRGFKRCCKSFTGFCIFHSISQFFYTSFYAIFGTLKQERAWNSENPTVENFRTVWVIILALVAPLFTISTHMGFILVAWLTNTSQASSVALLYLAALTYLFFMLRQCYSAHSNIRPKCCFWSVWLPLYPLWQCLRFAGAYVYIFCCCNKFYESIQSLLDPLCSYFCNHRCQQMCCCFCRKIDDQHKPLDREINKKTEDMDLEEDFNTKAFCVVFSWMWVLALPLGLAFFAFTELPIKTIQLFSDLLNTFQILILLVSLLITYKILSLSETDINRFLRKVRKVYLALRSDRGEEELTEVRREMENRRDVDDVEAAACLVGEMADVVVHKLPH